MKTVYKWRDLFRLSSVQILSIIPAIAAAREYSTELQALMPPELYAKVSAVIVIAGILARNIQQTKVVKK